MVSRRSIFIAIRYSLFSILYSLFFAAPTHAVVSCDLEPEYKGPEFALPITNAASCDMYDGDSPLFDKFIQEGEVRGVSNAELVGRYIGKEGRESELNDVEGSGDATVDLDKNTNIAIDPATLFKTTDKGTSVNQEIFTLKKVVSMSDNLSPVGINAECYASGITSRVDCAAKYGASITYPATGRVGVNTFTADTAYQKLTTLKGQLQSAKVRAKEMLDCQNPGVANTKYCGTNYAITKDGGNSKILADENRALINKLNLNEGTGEYFKLSKKQQLQLLAQDNKKAQTTLLVVQKIPTNLLSTVFDIAFGNKPYIIRGTNPGLQNIVDGLSVDFIRWNTLAKGKAEIAKIKGADGAIAGTTTESPSQINNTDAKGFGTTAGLSPAAIKKVTDKIEGADCGPVMTYSQLMGAVSTSKSSGAAVIHWTFSFDDIKKAIGDAFPMYVFKACAIDPPEYGQIAELTSKNPQSPTKSYYVTSKAPATDVDIHQEILSVPPTAGNDTEIDTGEQKVVPCPSGSTQQICYEDITETIKTEYSANNASLKHQGGEFAWNLTRNTFKGALLTLSDTERFNQCSYAADVQIRQPEKYAYLGTDTLTMKDPECPLPTTPTELGTCNQAFFIKGACPGGVDCIDYICDRAGSAGLDCGVVAMIAVNEDGGLFSCATDLSGIKHFGCDVDGIVKDADGLKKYDNSIDAKLSCAINTLQGDLSKPINEALAEYGYVNGVKDLPFGLYNLTPPTSLAASNNSAILSTLKNSIYGSHDEVFWWNSYCSRFSKLVEQSGWSSIDPAEYACPKNP